MSMFKKSMLTIMLTVFTLSVFAACPPRIKEYTQEFMTNLESRTTLSDEQKVAMEKVVYDNINVREDIISTYQGEKGMRVKKQLRDELQAVNANMQSEAQNVLDDQQYEAFLAVQKENQDKMRERINNEF